MAVQGVWALDSIASGTADSTVAADTYPVGCAASSAVAPGASCARVTGLVEARAPTPLGPANATDPALPASTARTPGTPTCGGAAVASGSASAAVAAVPPCATFRRLIVTLDERPSAAAVGAPAPCAACTAGTPIAIAAGAAVATSSAIACATAVTPDMVIAELGVRRLIDACTTVPAGTTRTTSAADTPFAHAGVSAVTAYTTISSITARSGVRIADKDAGGT